MRIIAGIHKGRVLQAVKSELLRPTTSMMREALFNICQQEIEGSSFLDLFAGIGAIGLEALSRGAKEVYFVEKERRHVEVIHANIALLQEQYRSHVLAQDVFKALSYLEKRGLSFDIIFADPPYGDKEYSLTNQLLEALDSRPLLKKGGRLFLEDHKNASSYSGTLKTLIEGKRRLTGKTTLREYRVF
jgi:16S rRNA (guanine(966)-N(2))-methyltransferase RsmD